MYKDGSRFTLHILKASSLLFCVSCCLLLCDMSMAWPLKDALLFNSPLSSFARMDLKFTDLTVSRRAFRLRDLFVDASSNLLAYCLYFTQGLSSKNDHSSFLHLYYDLFFIWRVRLTLGRNLFFVCNLDHPSIGASWLFFAEKAGAP
jgi:hypothetical protein